jgi:hypothetical protein
MVGVQCAIHAPRNTWTIFFLVCSVLKVQLGLVGPYLTKIVNSSMLHIFWY